MKLKHIHAIIASFAIGIVFLVVLVFAPDKIITSKDVVGTFVAILIATTVEVNILLYIERSELRETIAKIYTLQERAVPQLDEAKTEAKNIQQYVSSLDQHVLSLEQNIKQGLLATALDDPINVWQRVLDDACKADQSIYVAITVQDFSAPRDWDERLSNYLAKRKVDANDEIPYVLAIYRPQEQWTNDVKRRLKAINEIYHAKGLEQVIHGFVDQTEYFRFSLIIIDGKHVGFLWNSTGGDRSTKGI